MADDTLKELAELKKKAAELKNEHDRVIHEIRTGFVKRAIVFMDVVGSTQFKVDHRGEPEVWIYRVRQFSHFLAAAVENAGGIVVKFIGDEVMAMFENPNDALSLVARVEEVERRLLEATGYITRIKVAVDYGDVYLLHFDGHAAPDPQGSAVDRCARIGKYSQAGQVLASREFREVTPNLRWIKLGKVELKGLGEQTVFQLGQKTVDLTPMVEVKKDEFEALKQRVEDLGDEVQELKGKNERLSEQLREAGERADPADLASDDEDGDDPNWEHFEALRTELRKLISDAPVSSQTYARFLFLWNGQGVGERYDSNDPSFDRIIDSKLVVAEGGSSGYCQLDPAHRRNKRALELIRDAEDALNAYLRTNDPPPDEMFEWSMTDPEFWANHVGYNVLR